MTKIPKEHKGLGWTSVAEFFLWSLERICFLLSFDDVIIRETQKITYFWMILFYKFIEVTVERLQWSELCWFEIAWFPGWIYLKNADQNLPREPGNCKKKLFKVTPVVFVSDFGYSLSTPKTPEVKKMATKVHPKYVRCDLNFTDCKEFLTDIWHDASRLKVQNL